MNGRIKFHKANGPAFAPGQRWVAPPLEVFIELVRPYARINGKWDYEVTYYWFEHSLTPDGDIVITRKTHSKNAWSFQVRYTHEADERLRHTLNRRKSA